MKGRSFKVLWRRRLYELGLVLTLSVLLALLLAPLVMMAVLSLKSNAQIFAHFWQMPSPAHWNDYITAFDALRVYLWNTLVVASISVLGVVLFSSLSGYAFARLQFPGRNALYLFIIGLMMIPGILTLIPTYMLVRSLQLPAIHLREWMIGPYQLINTRWALILPYIAGGQVLGVLLCRTFLANLPEELFEAMRIDGAGELVIYRCLALPLSLPILATLTMLTVLSIYNDYIWPLVVISNDSLQTFSVGITRFASVHNLDYGPTFAGYVIGSLPLIAIFAVGMRAFVRGVTSGSLKA